MIVIKKKLLDDYIKYTRVYFSDAGTTEDLNKMHTYRDGLCKKIRSLYTEKQIEHNEYRKYEEFIRNLSSSCNYLKNVEIYKLLEVIGMKVEE